MSYRVAPTYQVVATCERCATSVLDLDGQDGGWLEVKIEHDCPIPDPVVTPEEALAAIIEKNRP